MELNEIEAQADALLERLAGFTVGAGEARDICFRLDALSSAASIKATVAHQKRADNQAYMPTHAYMPAPVSLQQCPATEFVRGDAFRCSKPAGHMPAAAHAWMLAVPAEEPTKPAADRLHELVSYGKQMEASNRTVEYPCPDAADAYQDMATKLDEILREGLL